MTIIAIDRNLPSSVVLEDFGEGPRLAVSRCATCGEHRYPPRALCVNDLAEMERIPASATGKLITAVRMERPPYGFEGAIWVGYVDLPEGVRVFTRLDPRGQDLVPGMDMAHKVGVVRTIPKDVLGPLFFPASSEPASGEGR